MQRCCRLMLFAVVLSLPCMASAQAMPDVAAMDPDAMAQMYTSMGNPGSAARMSDSEATCEQLYAESTYLEARVAAMPKAQDPMQASVKMQEEMMQAQKKMMGGMRAKGVASSLLGMVPGIGGIAGGLASSAMSRGGNMDAINEVTRKAMADMQKNTQAMMAVAQLEMRNDHVTQLFLSRGCRVSTLDASSLSTARSHLERSDGKEAGGVAASAPPQAVQSEAVQPEAVQPEAAKP